MAKVKWSTVVKRGIAAYESGKYVYFYGAKDIEMTYSAMHYLAYEDASTSPAFLKYSAQEMEQIFRNCLSKPGIDCSGFVGWLCTGDKRYSTGQIENSKKCAVADAKPGYILYTTFGNPKKRHIGLYIGKVNGVGYCLQAGYEPTDAALKAGIANIILTPVQDTPWEIAGASNAVDYTDVTETFAATTALVEKVFGPTKTPKWVAEATTLVNVRTEPVVRNDINGYPLNRLPQYPMLGTGNLVDVCDDTHHDGWYYVRIAGQYYGWVMSKYFKKPAPMTPEVGDKVRFTGTKIYTSSYSNGKGVAVPNFTAKVTQKNDKAHPYLLKSTGKDGYEGWANTSDVQLI